MSSVLRDLVRKAWGVVDTETMLGLVEQLCRFDRFQASQGILGAAQTVKDAALRLGLEDVRIHEFPADGQSSFWTFQSPRSWTPSVGVLEVQLPSGKTIVLDQANQPFLLATYSAPTEHEGVSAPLVFPEADVTGCVVLLDSRSFADRRLLTSLEKRGALGFVTDACYKVDLQHQQVSGRIELDPWTRLFGFSVTAQQFARIATSSRVRVRIRVDRSAVMPAVSALLPASSPRSRDIGREFWLTAHLCHPRPGANDNASGIAALLGTAAALKALAIQDPEWALRYHPVRLIWAPEFVGTAAVLHEAIAAGGPGRFPIAVFNLDMVGENQELCGSPFVVERGPETLPTLLGPLAELAVSEVFQHSAEHGGTWRVSPFLGYSDHALFSGPDVHCPIIQFAHWPDKFNHSGADTLDKVSPVELRRSVTAATVSVYCAVSDYRPVREELPSLLRTWCAQEEQDVAHLVLTQRPRTNNEWYQRLQSHVKTLGELALSTYDSFPTDVGALYSEPILLPESWRGPLNLRAILAGLSLERHVEILQLIADNKLVLAVLANLAVRERHAIGADQLFESVEFALRRPLDRKLLETLRSALRESGWTTFRDV